MPGATTGRARPHLQSHLAVGIQIDEHNRRIGPGIVYDLSAVIGGRQLPLWKDMHKHDEAAVAGAGAWRLTCAPLDLITGERRAAHHPATLRRTVRAPQETLPLAVTGGADRFTHPDARHFPRDDERRGVGRVGSTRHRRKDPAAFSDRPRDESQPRLECHPVAGRSSEAARAASRGRTPGRKRDHPWGSAQAASPSHPQHPPALAPAPRRFTRGQAENKGQ
jgi:hypothetical protein